MTVNDTEERGKKCGKKLVPPDCPQKVLASGDYNHYESGENRQN